MIARPEDAYPSLQSVPVAASLEERVVVSLGMRTIAVKEKHLHIVRQRSFSEVGTRRTSNLDRNSSMAALSPDRNWGAIFPAVSLY